MSPFRDWYRKEAPVFTGISRGVGGYGFGRYVSAVSAAIVPVAARAIYFGGATVNTIQYVQIETTGNATSFGTLATTGFNGACSASTTRAVYANGRALNINQEYVTIATTGNSLDFGALNTSRRIFLEAGCNSTTRGIVPGGTAFSSGSTASTVIDYFTFATTGTASSFGSLTLDRYFGPAGASSPTRGVIFGGVSSGFVQTNVIDYITIASTGNATSFGTCARFIRQCAGTSNATRALFHGGVNTNSAATVASIDYLEIATTGNSNVFGNLSSDRRASGATSNNTRAICGGGENNSGVTTNVIQSNEISTLGDSVSFGTLTANLIALTATSSYNGGVQA
jgi:hypothetical protein